METIDCTIARKVFHGPSKFGHKGGVPYLIARCGDGLTIKGQMKNPVVGQKYRLWGSMRPQKGGYPDAFEFSAFEPLCDRSTGGIVKYIISNIFGIGHVKATALVDKFGVDTLDILRKDPGMATQVGGITDDNVKSIHAHFAETKSLDPMASAKLTELFDGYRFPKKLVDLCIKAWGSSAPEIIEDNPYLLIDFPRVGWKLTDAFAIGRAGYPEGGIDRHIAGLVEALKQLGNDGHTAATPAEMLTSAQRLLGSPVHPDALDKSITDGHIAISNDGSGKVYQLADLARAERTIAEQLETLRDLGPEPISHFVEPLSPILKHLGVDQINAAVMVGKHPVSIVTGPPGTGKSFLVSRLIKRLRELGHTSIRCCAPTGKAAKRMFELLIEVGITDIPCTTIHKALEPGPAEQDESGVPKDDAKFGRGRDGWSFKRDSQNPIIERIVIIDEPSMLDARLGASLLSAIAPGTRVVFVGDCNQLPSVGPGAVLRDMVDGGIPTTTLTEIRRSDTCGTVVHACHAIIRDEIPKCADEIDLATGKNWIHVELDDPDEIASEIVKINMSIKTFDRIWETQVISPQKARLKFGCDNLNTLLGKALNPENRTDNLLTDPFTGETIGVSDDGGEPRIGDKVVRTKNEIVDELFEAPPNERPDLTWNSQLWVARPCPVVNGDMGTVVDILYDAILVWFRDPNRFCRLAINNNELMLAYASTVHRMQGSGSPVVIMPLHHGFFFDDRANKGIWCRELVYTAISRTEKLLITVGQWSALITALRRKTVNRRRTTLLSRLTRKDNPEVADDGNPEIVTSESGFEW